MPVALVEEIPRVMLERLKVVQAPVRMSRRVARYFRLVAVARRAEST